jgi:thioredoxin reductase
MFSNPEAKYRAPVIDVYSSEDSVEEKSIELFEQIKNGSVSIDDLMGPLNPRDIENMAQATIPPGQKSYFPKAEESEFYPMDDNNKLLKHHVHPENYINPESSNDYDLVAIGAGVSGLISVIIGSWLGKRCALIERHNMGGDCLNIGCVPSKALISCAHAAHNVQKLKNYGIKIPEGKVEIDFGFVMTRMREIRAKISHHDSVQRYSRDFCEHVYVGNGKFIEGKNQIEVIGDDGTSRILTFKKAMIATGASAAIPIPILREIPHLTNSNLFNLVELPPRLLVIGSGPIGLEISQAMSRFGSQVICFEMAPKILMREDPDATDILSKQLEDDGE